MSATERGRWRGDAAAAALADAEAVSMRRIDEADAVPRPDTVSVTYVESEYQAKSSEQEHLFDAEGEKAARQYRVQAAGWKRPADEAGFLVEGHRAVVESARDQYLHAVGTLTPHVRRSWWAGYLYLGAWLILGGGDTAGVLGAAILLGEVPWIALGQALATGFAAVTAGRVGGEVKNLHLSRQRQRDPDKLSPDEQRYRQLFDGPKAGRGVGIVGWACVTVAILVTMGIFNLRLAVEGMVAAVAFGSLAGATVLASFIASYAYFDEVADLIATTKRNYGRARREQRKLAAVPVVKRYARASAMVESLTGEFEQRGRAASQHLMALCQRILGRNAQVMGHGPAPEPEPDPTVGRRYVNGQPR